MDTQNVLKFLLLKGFCRESKIARVFSTLSVQSNVDENGWQEAFRLVNDSLAPLSMEVKKSKYDADGEVYWTVVNNNYGADDISKLGTAYDKGQIEFFKVLADEIVTAGGSLFVSEVITKLGPKLKIDKKSLEATVRSLNDQGWIGKVGNGKGESVILGVRATTELHHWLNSMDNIPSCAICKKKCIYGKVCEGKSVDGKKYSGKENKRSSRGGSAEEIDGDDLDNRVKEEDMSGGGGCGVKVHIYCLATVNKGKKTSTCPNCKLHLE